MWDYHNTMRLFKGLAYSANIGMLFSELFLKYTKIVDNVVRTGVYLSSPSHYYYTRSWADPFIHVRELFFMDKNEYRGS